MKENLFRGLLNRILQILTMLTPGGSTLRVWLHRARGVQIGRNVWISYNVILETAFPQLITIGMKLFLGSVLLSLRISSELGEGFESRREPLLGRERLFCQTLRLGKAR